MKATSLEYARPQVRLIISSCVLVVALPTAPAARAARRGVPAVISGRRDAREEAAFNLGAEPRAPSSPTRTTPSCPAGRVTAATGMDALTHNVESYLSPLITRCDGIALERPPGGARARDRGGDAEEHRGAIRHDDGPMMGRSPSVGIWGSAFVRARAGHRRRHAPRPGERHAIDHVMRFNPTPPIARWRFACLRRRLHRFAFVDWLGAWRPHRHLGAPWRRGYADQIPKLVAVAVSDTRHQTNPSPFGGRFRGFLAGPVKMRDGLRILFWT